MKFVQLLGVSSFPGRFSIGFLLTLLQPQLRCRDRGQSVGSAFDLAGDVNVGLALLQVIGRLGAVEQTVDLRLESGSLAASLRELKVPVA